MPGAKLAEFRNPLRFGSRPGIRVIDVLLDIILPELASIPERDQRPPILTPEQFEAVGPGVFTDLEASRVRAQVALGNQPTANFPGGGTLPDVTWAFNQATGARPEQAELDTESGEDWRRDDGGTNYVADPLTGRPIFAINANLPSLNRQPGIILVPIGLFPILGTIRLYGGQQLVGISAGADGSCLIKYGDGHCIQTRVAADVLDEPWLSTESAVARAGFAVREVPHLERLWRAA